MSNVDVIVEIPKNTNIKYEYDEDLGMIRCDRILNTPMMYPANYGYIPGTLSGDGDPLDVLVLCDFSLHPNTVINCKIIGVLSTTDEKGVDDKIIAVPNDKIDRNSKSYDNISDVSDDLKESIKYFFEHYKDLEKDKWVVVNSFENKEKAVEILEKCQV